MDQLLASREGRCFVDLVLCRKSGDSAETQQDRQEVLLRINIPTYEVTIRHSSPHSVELLRELFADCR